MATKGKDPLVTALQEIEGFAPPCSKESAALSEATERDKLDAYNWRDAVRRLQAVARKALREAGEGIG